MVYARLAIDAGIHMPPTQLFETPQGARYFGVQRFDRAQGRRVHAHTFGNLIHADFRLPSCDYEQLLDVTRRLTRRQDDVTQCFRRMVFNIATHNRDDHVKNFAFLMDSRGAWHLSPAYDLMFSSGPGGEHTTSVAGQGRAPGRQHVLQLAEVAGLSQQEAAEIIGEVIEAASRFRRYAQELEIPGAVQREIDDVIQPCMERLR